MPSVSIGNAQKAPLSFCYDLSRRRYNKRIVNIEPRIARTHILIVSGGATTL